jgi:alkanesulfonate monooxygenase SsuD/methylene tetrahydromethanopterin reductase-like flavin-dependent oxidoreductase (luciferase family)
MRPLQKPHPPIWIPGVVSPESVRWAAEHRYPYVALAPPLGVIDEIYDLYDEVALETGFTPTSEHRGYVIRVSVADTDEEAYEQGRHFYWQLGTSFGIAPRQWLQPAGYVTRAARESRREQARTGAVNITPAAPRSRTRTPTPPIRSCQGTRTRSSRSSSTSSISSIQAT